jgi:hypothetical protein
MNQDENQNQNQKNKKKAILKELMYLARAYKTDWKEDQLPVWIEKLIDISPELLHEAIDRLVTRSHFFPMIADLRTEAMCVAENRYLENKAPGDQLMLEHREEPLSREEAKAALKIIYDRIDKGNAPLKLVEVSPEERQRIQEKKDRMKADYWNHLALSARKA